MIAPAPASRRTSRLRLAGLRAPTTAGWPTSSASPPTVAPASPRSFLNDVDEAVKDVQWTKEQGLSGVLLPGVSPTPRGSTRSPRTIYDPFWAVCQETSACRSRTTRVAAASPTTASTRSSMTLFVIETGLYANHAFWHMIWGGVFERFPDAEAGAHRAGLGLGAADARPAWTASTAQMASGRIGELGVHPKRRAALTSAERVLRAQRLGRGQLSRRRGRARLPRRSASDKVMWGSDYPHHEASLAVLGGIAPPRLRGWAEADMRKVLSRTPPTSTASTSAKLAASPAEIGPTVDEIATPLDEIPGRRHEPRLPAGLRS